MQIDIFGFQSGEQLALWLTAPDEQVLGAERTITVGPDGSLTDLRYPTRGLWPGRWYWVFQGQESGRQAVVFYHVYQP